MDAQRCGRQLSSSHHHLRTSWSLSHWTRTRRTRHALTTKSGHASLPGLTGHRGLSLVAAPRTVRVVHVLTAPQSGSLPAVVHAQAACMHIVVVRSRGRLLQYGTAWQARPGHEADAPPPRAGLPPGRPRRRARSPWACAPGSVQLVALAPSPPVLRPLFVLATPSVRLPVDHDEVLHRRSFRHPRPCQRRRCPAHCSRPRRPQPLVESVFPLSSAYAPVG